MYAQHGGRRGRGRGRGNEVSVIFLCFARQFIILCIHQLFGSWLSYHYKNVQTGKPSLNILSQFLHGSLGSS